MSTFQLPPPVDLTLTLSANPNVTVQGRSEISFKTADYDGSVPQLVAMTSSFLVNLTQFNTQPVDNGDGTFTFSGAAITAAQAQVGSVANVQVQVEGQNNQDINVTVVEGDLETGAVTVGAPQPPVLNIGQSSVSGGASTSSTSSTSSAAAPAAKG